MSINQDIKELIDDFLNQELTKIAGIETVILCGSYAMGRATSRSDIDLCCIGNIPTFKRKVIVFRNKEFQLMIAPWSWYEDVIKNYERKNNVGTITTMLSQGICIYGSSEKWIELHKLSKEYFEIGPVQPSEKELHRARMQITDLMDDYLDQAGQSVNQLWLLYHIIETCIEYHFIVKAWWAVKPKYQIEELAKKDPYMSSIVIKCLTTEGKDKHLVYKLCDYVLKPIGGFLRESWGLE